MRMDLTANRGRPNADQQLLNRKNIEEDEDNALLMSPLLDGFSLNEKKWSEYTTSMPQHVAEVDISHSEFSG